jgi:DNA-binding NarL/FixJ family response regulator
MDVLGENSMYDEFMIRTFISDKKPEERSALRLLLQDLNMLVVGEAADWPATLENAPTSGLNMLLIDWSILPQNQRSALGELRALCPKAMVVILLSHIDARKQAALSVGADAFISKSDPPERVASFLRTIANDTGLNTRAVQ